MVFVSSLSLPNVSKPAIVAFRQATRPSQQPASGLSSFSPPTSFAKLPHSPRKWPQLIGLALIVTAFVKTVGPDVLEWLRSTPAFKPEPPQPITKPQGDPDCDAQILACFAKLGLSGGIPREDPSLRISDLIDRYLNIQKANAPKTYSPKHPYSLERLLCRIKTKCTMSDSCLQYLLETYLAPHLSQAYSGQVFDQAFYASCLSSH